MKGRGRVFGVLGVIVAVAAVAVIRRTTGLPRPEHPCGPGFFRAGPRCIPPAGWRPSPDDRVLVPETTLTVGPSDWEAEGRVAARTVHVRVFYMDRFEVDLERFSGSKTDPFRSAAGVSLAEARDFCRAHGGRLPTDDEWVAAAAGAGGTSTRRYPWGDTGAVCRRAAWGIEKGPCADGAAGPDTVGAHPDGATPLGIQDLAGNVAEWTEPPDGGAPAVRGGSWKTQLATELRTWDRREAPPEARDGTIGFRCAYDAVP